MKYYGVVTGKQERDVCTNTRSVIDQKQWEWKNIQKIKSTGMGYLRKTTRISKLEWIQNEEK